MARVDVSVVFKAQLAILCTESAPFKNVLYQYLAPRSSTIPDRGESSTFPEHSALVRDPFLDVICGSYHRQ
ncbi:hypothetical protein Y032_0134g1846 [Ancylostoma ceylanicum]|uniref:Uncharacterized protein n=1 Tax=Ancylostoma ceylanicum TaxID=53326 RepID=A0A016T645_9BILA|nr:hypothetical protein Y032_0134g1846 [Ancylostoma ceylanicum]